MLGQKFFRRGVGEPFPKNLCLRVPCHDWRANREYAIAPLMSVLLAEKLVRDTPPNGGGYGSNNRIPESLLVRLWQKKAARQEWLRTHGGTKIRVIYPGSVGTGAGPGFRNALLEVEGEGLVRGDVEIHIRQKDWESHGHGGDPNYNGVVLHAALEVDGQDTQLQSGGHAPVLSLMPLLDSEGFAEKVPGSTALPANAGLWAVLGQHGYPAPKSPEQMGESLDLAGNHRFWAKREYLTLLLREQTPEYTLYENLMEGLGYRYNQQPFLKLAARAPFAALRRGAGGLPREGRTRALTDWLIRQSSLSFSEIGPSGITSGGPQDREPPAKVGFGAPLLAKEWHCFRLRPSNHPRRRIMGAAILLERFLD